MKNALKNILRPSLEEETMEQQNNSKDITETMEEKRTQSKPSFERAMFKPDKHTSNIFTNTGKAVKIAEPKNLEDAEVITAAIQDDITILLFLDSVTEEAMASRILDFINGYCHALDIMPQATKQPNLWLYDPNNKKTTKNYR